MKKIAIIACVLFSHFAHSQSLDARWNQLINRSNSYKSHKVIKEGDLDRMWMIVQDSMIAARANINLEKKRVRDQQMEISSLKRKASEAQKTVSTQNVEKNRILRSRASADDHITTLWIALAVISAVGFVLFLLFKRSNDITSNKEEEYEALKKTFEEYKVQKMESERKLKREIQTYMNKLQDLQQLS